jgi:hypothetical protein
VVREGDTFTFQQSADGQTWQTSATVTESMVVSSAGVFAATAHNAPGFEARVDYVQLSGAPLDDDATVPARPQAADDLFATEAGTEFVFTADELLANDTDRNGDPLTVVSVGAPDHGTVTDDGDSSFTYDPAAGFTGVDRFAYTIGDGTDTDTATVLVEVDNTGPIAVDDTVSLAEDGSALFTPLANDSDPDGDALQIVAIGTAAHGSAVVNDDGTVGYTPAANFNGTDTVTYAVSDGVRDALGSITLTVSPVEDLPNLTDDALFTPPDDPLVIDVGQDLLANDTDADGDPLSVASVTQPVHGTIADNGDGTLTYTPAAGFTGDDTFTYTASDGDDTASATVTVTVRDAIDLWFGDVQTFGQPGEAQEWINILGNVVPAGLQSLTYSLNGGAQKPLGVGPDTRRLQDPGDFNIDLAYDALDPTSADDVVTITATYDDGTVFSRDVTVDYEDGASWPTDYSINWSSVGNLQDVVQVADGTWAVDGDGVRPVDLGYDRLLVLGDSSWDNYELRTSITMNDLENVDPRGRDGGAFAIGMLWGGHTDAPVAGAQPKSGWEPGAAFFFTGSNFKLHSFHDFDELLGVSKNTLQEGTTYEVVVRVEQTGLYDRLYSLKVWESGTPEPAAWTLQGVEQFSIDEAPETGALYLNAHYFDVTFNDLTVEAIEGDDILVGDGSDDRLVAVDTVSGTPGRDEIDVFRGDGGSDTFIFGDASGDFYDDGVADSSGESDFGFVWDFTPGTDFIELHGSPDDYVVTDAPTGIAEGAAIYRSREADTALELIGVLSGVDPTEAAASILYLDPMIA